MVSQEPWRLQSWAPSRPEGYVAPRLAERPRKPVPSTLAEQPLPQHCFDRFRFCYLGEQESQENILNRLEGELESTASPPCPPVFRVKANVGVYCPATPHPEL